MSELQPFFEQVQAIYDDDHCSEFLDLFLDPSLLYSCAYFQRDDMTLSEAQIAKLDLSLDKCDLQPGQTLLEVGCGWGACAYHAAATRRVNVIGLTLSKSQLAYCEQKIQVLPPGSGNVEFRHMGWEQFEEPVDRIISIAAFEHFGWERQAKFFKHCRRLLPPDGRLMVHAIVNYDLKDLEEKGLEVTHEGVLFMKFIAKEIFPGGKLSPPKTVIRQACNAGFRVAQAQSLRRHYARTLDIWAENLQANREEAIRRKSTADYDRFMKYLTGCAERFRAGYIDVFQFTCVPIQ